MKIQLVYGKNKASKIDEVMHTDIPLYAVTDYDNFRGSTYIHKKVKAALEAQLRDSFRDLSSCGLELLSENELQPGCYYCEISVPNLTREEIQRYENFRKDELQFYKDHYDHNTDYYKGKMKELDCSDHTREVYIMLLAHPEYRRKRFYYMMTEQERKDLLAYSCTVGVDDQEMEDLERDLDEKHRLLQEALVKFTSDMKCIARALCVKCENGAIVPVANMEMVYHGGFFFRNEAPSNTFGFTKKEYETIERKRPYVPYVY